MCTLPCLICLLLIRSNRDRMIEPCATVRPTSWYCLHACVSLSFEFRRRVFSKDSNGLCSFFSLSLSYVIALIATIPRTRARIRQCIAMCLFTLASFGLYVCTTGLAYPYPYAIGAVICVVLALFSTLHAFTSTQTSKTATHVVISSGLLRISVGVNVLIHLVSALAHAIFPMQTVGRYVSMTIRSEIQPYVRLNFM